MSPAPDDTKNSPAQSQEHHEACEPFNDPDADTILRTSDLVDFRIYKIILSLASPVFRAMFRTYQSDSGNIDAPSVFDIPEDARTIEYILRCCYPLPSPSMTALQDLRPILYAAQKYGITAVTSVAKLSLEHCISQDILGVFSVASRCELEDVCTKAVKESLRDKLTSLNSVHLDQISARQLYKLLQYHRRYRIDTSVPTSSVIWCSKNSCVSTPHWMLRHSRFTKPVSVAASRFDEKNADIILRSSYPQTDFRVHNVILSLASPIFRDMSELAQPMCTPTPLSGDITLPVIDVTEDPYTLESMLYCIYPVQSPVVDGLDRVRLLLEAGRKYDIDVVQALAKAALIKCIDQDVLGTFAIALRYDLSDVCVMAAKTSLQYPLMSLNSTELDHFPAHNYHKLLAYYEGCRAAVSHVMSSREWFTDNILDVTGQSNVRLFAGGYDYCSHCQVLDRLKKKKQWRAPQQLWDYLEHAEQLLEDRPHHSTVLSEEALVKWTSPTVVCPDCRRTYMRDIFSRALATEIEQAVAKVNIPNFL